MAFSINPLLCTKYYLYKNLTLSQILIFIHLPIPNTNNIKNKNKTEWIKRVSYNNKKIQI